MFKRSLIAVALTLGMAGAAQAAKVGGVEIPDTMSVAGQTLDLNGAGVRSKWFIDVYVSGLYLAKPTQDAAAIIQSDEPKAIRLHMISSMVTSEKMKKATEEGFSNATNGNVAPIRGSIDQFMAIFDEKIEENDVFDIAFLPGKGIQVSKNEQIVNTIDGGADFQKAVFGIWLSDKPAQEDLKEEMLGK